jgi:hypothetical protein
MLMQREKGAAVAVPVQLHSFGSTDGYAETPR